MGKNHRRLGNYDQNSSSIGRIVSLLSLRDLKIQVKDSVDVNGWSLSDAGHGTVPTILTTISGTNTGCGAILFALTVESGHGLVAAVCIDLSGATDLAALIVDFPSGHHRVGPSLTKKMGGISGGPYSLPRPSPPCTLTEGCQFVTKPFL